VTTALGPLGALAPLADSMSPEMARRLASVVAPSREAEAGSPLPPLWHWAYFATIATAEETGADGHRRQDVPRQDRFPRRMAGGGSLQLGRPLVLGQPAEKTSVLEGAEEKRGRAGPLLVCHWRHIYTQAGKMAIEEAQTLIYLPGASPERAAAGSEVDSGGAGSAPPSAAQAPPGEAPRGTAADGWPRLRRLHFDPVTLFRFSAATWNSHRIHYDRDYASSEGYPGLVVHGPLLAVIMAGEAENAIGPLGFVEYRAHAPVFDTDAVELYIDANESTCRLEARKADGVVATSLSATGVR
jgi:3-methylfumaryl-CoA hydratase